MKKVLREAMSEAGKMKDDYVSTEHLLLAERGYDPVYGARPLKRLIRKWIQNPLARYVLENEPERGTVLKARYRKETDSTGFETGISPAGKQRPAK